MKLKKIFSNLFISLSNKGEEMVVKKIFLRLASAWTLLLITILVFLYSLDLKQVEELARVECLSSFQKDIQYRAWATSHGGVYVPVTPKTKPNEYLTNVPEREIATPSGRALTLMNPAYMSRQVFELDPKKYNSRNHITSLNPIRPQNAPTEWEKEALAKFEKGSKEVFEITGDGEKKVARYMAPFKVEQGCLKCHAAQGYNLGDIRGGISVEVDWEPFANIFRSTIAGHSIIVSFIWIVGVFGFVFAHKKMKETVVHNIALLNANPDMMFIISEEGTIINAKLDSRDQTGERPEKLVGRNIKELIPREIQDQILSGIRKVKSTGSLTVILIDLFRNGELKKYENRIVPYGEDQFLFIARNISQLSRAEVALRKSEEKFRTAVENMQEAFLLFDLNGRLLMCNSSAEKILGYKESELLGKTPFDTQLKFIREDGREFPPEERPAIASLRNGTVMQNVVMGVKQQDSDIRWVLLNSVPILSADKIDGVLITAVDITERKRIEEIRKHSHDLMSYVIEHNRSAVAVHDRDLNYVYVSNSYKEQYRIKDENIIGKHHYEVFPDLPQKWRDVHQRALKGEILNAEDDPYYKADGTVEWTRWECRPWYEMDGSIGGIVVYTEVITPRKEMENRLRESEELFRSVVLNSLEVTVLSRTDGLVYYVSPQCREILGYGEEKFIGGRFPDIIHPDDLERCRYEWIDVYERQGEVNEYEYRIIDEEGNTRWISHSAKRLKLQDNLWVVQNTIRNITERKTTEEELKRHREHLEELVESRTEELDALNRELVTQIIKKQETELLLQASLEKEKELNKLKSRFISTASHEFKTPLTTVLSSVELIQRYGKNWDDEKREIHLDRIKSAVVYLTNLINEVLFVSRADSGRLEFNPSITNLHSLCQQVIEEGRLYGGDNHNFVFNYAGENKFFNLDSKHVYTILQNLVSNAVKYSPHGGAVELSVRQEGNAILFFVRDEGIGVPENEQYNLFQPFHRCENVGTISGTGLGLTIVKNAVDLHKGKISIHSKPGKGATFIVEIPVG